MRISRSSLVVAACLLLSALPGMAQTQKPPFKPIDVCRKAHDVK